MFQEGTRTYAMAEREMENSEKMPQRNREWEEASLAGN